MNRALAGLCLALALGAHAADPVAFVADVKGQANVEGDGKLAFLAELAPGTRLLLGTGSVVAITYATSGSEFTLTGPGEFLVTPTEVRADRGAKPARRSIAPLPDAGIVTRVARTATASLRMRGLVPDVPPKAALEYPVNTRIATLQPTLRWEGEGTASVMDAQGKEVWKGSSKRSAIKLAPGTVYTWTVVTAKGPLGEARFETLPAEAIARAEKSRAATRNFTDRVMHAFVLQDLGAAQDARDAWAELARERPDLPELAGLAR
jgi:hypothetical protein